MKNLQEMKKAELQAVAEEEGVMYGAKTTVAELVSLIEKNRGNGKQTAGTFKLLKSEYHAREDAKVSKEWTPKSGELKILREIEWNSDRNDKDETLVFFKVGNHPEEHLTFSGMLVAAAQKAGIELIIETGDGLAMQQGFPVSIAARKFAFDTV